MNFSNISLPAERYQQLAALARREGKTVADTIGDFLVEAIYQGRIEDQLPGWTIERTGDMVHLAIEETPVNRKLSLAGAVSLAESLAEMAKPGIARSGILDMDAGFRIERRGLAVRLICLESEERRSLSRSIAEDIAHRLRRAAS